MLTELTIGIVANACYKAIEIGAANLFEKTKEFIKGSTKEAVDDQSLNQVCSKIRFQDLDGDMSAKKIEKILSEDRQLVSVIDSISGGIDRQQKIIQQINQHGDNNIGDIRF